MSHLRIPVGPLDHVEGSAGASLMLVEYGDYECGYCGSAAPVLKQVQQRLGSRLRFVFRHFPLIEMHPHAMQAAETAEAAGAQGKFWEMHDLLFAHQGALGPRQLLAYAGQLGLDLARVRDDLETHVHRARIEADISGGARSGVNGTPTLFLGAERFEGRLDLVSILEAVRAEGPRAP
jgi:protein-disulfide isomerase